MEAIIALDIGTTAAKAVLMDQNGQILTRAQVGYQPVWRGAEVEQDAAEWWKAAQACLRSITQQKPANVQVAALVLSGQMQDVILMGRQGVLAPVILYSDGRAQAEADEVLHTIGEDRLITVTGNLQDTSGLLAKLLWIKRNRMEWYQQTQTLLIGAHDYITAELCGEHITDPTTASTTGLFHLRENRWAVELLESLNLRTDWLPRLDSAEAPVGRVGRIAAELTGLPEGLPVFHGAGDAATTTLGASAGEEGRWYVYLGTSGWLAATVDAPPADPRAGIFNLRHPDTKRLILIGPMITAAGNFEWLIRQFGALERGQSAGEDAHTLLNRMAESAAAGCNGVLYLPYLSGERAPFRDERARGVFFGLSALTSRAELYRAVLEGVAFAMRTIRDAMPSAGRIEGISLVGGGARSGLWPQIFADVFGWPVQVLAQPEDVGCRGAALLASKALGWQRDFSPQGYFPVERAYQPIVQNQRCYDELYGVFRGLYPALKDSFHLLASVKCDPAGAGLPPD
ncbi:MAG: FGGY-family carbohydrate kinase [Anaerolineae bacterium]|nr:FGGY-family carbohydrate kinase [Candidatus Roseilinea sp.]MDW8449295.1 FGGY-family carbohydrate kinase [Anaerolineae bacterium]